MIKNVMPISEENVCHVEIDKKHLGCEFGSVKEGAILRCIVVAQIREVKVLL